MRIIGLTGGIASGKSTVSAMLRELGAQVIDADAVARCIVAPGQPAWQDIVAHFGAKVLQQDRTIDRKMLGDIVFNDASERETLDGITHRRVREVVERQISEAGAQGMRAVVLDVPLLFEAGWQSMADEVWVVYVDRATQLSRLMQRNGYSRQEAALRISSQMSLEEKRRLADVVIDNNGDRADACRQVAEQWNKLE